MLSHYDGVIWYTGDDIVTRKAGPGRRQRRPARARRDARDPRVHGRGRPRRLHGQARRAAVLGRRVGNQYYDPKNEVTVQPGPAAPRPGTRGVPAAARLRVRRRPRQRRARVLVRRRRPGRRRRVDRDGTPFDLLGVDDPFDGLAVVAQRRGERQQPGHELVVRRDERHPAARRVPAVRELAVVALGQAGRAVRSALGHPVRLLADRRRVLQAADPRDRGAGRRRRA